MDNKIKEILKERGISQKQLCEMTGMSEAGMSKAINGTATESTLTKIAEALDVDISELTGEQPPYAKYSADKTPLKLGSVEIPCYVLNNGMRVFSGRGLQKALGADNTSGTWLSKFIKSDAIVWNTKPGIIELFDTPVKFKRNNAGGSQSMTYGYEATLLIDLCSAIIDAYENPAFGISEIYYKRANVIIRAVAKVGIIALIDEATGYDKAKERAKGELQSWLSTFINNEAEKWVKTFPDQFFEDIYKMRHWNWDKSIGKPQFIGKIINDIVYERIAPLVYNELRRKNPKSGKGYRKYKFHQFLTSDVGKPALERHLAVLHSFALASDYNWARFMYLLDKSNPKQYQQLALFDEFDIE